MSFKNCPPWNALQKKIKPARSLVETNLIFFHRSLWIPVFLGVHPKTRFSHPSQIPMRHFGAMMSIITASWGWLCAGSRISIFSSLGGASSSCWSWPMNTPLFFWKKDQDSIFLNTPYSLVQNNAHVQTHTCTLASVEAQSHYSSLFLFFYITETQQQPICSINSSIQL